MTTCRDCVHWGTPSEEFQYLDYMLDGWQQSNHRPCGAIVPLKEINLLHRGTPKAFTRGLDGGASEQLLTAPDFGCALAEPR